jgi:hypothetical protein
MEAYRRIDPTAPERILREFEINSQHVRDTYVTGLNATINRDKRA